MTPAVAVDDPDFTLHVGDARDVLPTLPSGIVDCVVSSPPFYGLRDYGVPDQIGLEATPEEWVKNLVAVFRECRRLLKPAGVMWVECGDSYASGESGRKDNGRLERDHDRWRQGMSEQAPRSERRYSRPSSLKPKDLLGQPWLLAFALRADGWYLRQCVIWHKPNAMPESVRDRCTTAHSYVFLLSKSPRYWFDADAIAEPSVIGEGAIRNIGCSLKGPNSDRKDNGRMGVVNNGTKNARSVWTIPTAGYPDAHFATFPEQLVERMLKAGCPEWVCVSCGKARERLGETVGEWRAQHERPAKHNGEIYRTNPGGGLAGVNTSRERRTTGWSDCGCGHGFAPGTVLDPFMGSGTTALVARRLGRRAIGVELNPEYAEMAARRLQQLSLLA